MNFKIINLKNKKKIFNIYKNQELKIYCNLFLILKNKNLKTL
jgi:hypothetical protein